MKCLCCEDRGWVCENHPDQLNATQMARVLPTPKMAGIRQSWNPADTRRTAGWNSSSYIFR